MRVGLIGCGAISNLHYPIILEQPDTEIVGLADNNIKSAKALAEKIGIDSYYTSAEKMLNVQKPDVVHILTPPQYHAELALLSLEKNCHVIVEKPMASNLAEAQKMVSTAKNKGLKLLVAHNLIYDNMVRKAKTLASQGHIGKIVSVEASFAYDARRNPAIMEEGAQYCHWSFKLNGGPLQDLMPHPASLIMEFIPEIKEIRSIGVNRGLLPNGYHDEIRVLVRSEKIVGFINISLNEKPDIVSFTLKGNKGTIMVDLYSGVLIMQRKSNLPRPIIRGVAGLRLANQYLKGSLINICNYFTGRIDKSNGRKLLISTFYKMLHDVNGYEESIKKSINVVKLIDSIWPEPLVDNQSLIKVNKNQKISDKEPLVLVTGASGFIGTYLVKKLMTENYNIRALIRQNSIRKGRLSRVNLEIVEGDLADSKIFKDITKGTKVVFHAGFPMGNNWKECEEVGVCGTKKLVEAALSNGVERFIYLSSLAVYNISKSRNGNIAEDCAFLTKRKNMSPYAWAKIETEKLLLDAYKEHGLKVTIIRPGIVFGPLGRVFFPHLGFRYQDKIFFIIGDGNSILPLTYIENTVDGIYRASISENAIGEKYNLVDGNEITTRKYIKKFNDITGASAHIVRLPYMIPYCASAAYELGAYLGLLRKGVTSRAQLKTKQTRVKFVSEKAKNELGWEPEVSLEEGLVRTFEYYKARFLTIN